MKIKYYAYSLHKKKTKNSDGLLGRHAMVPGYLIPCLVNTGRGPLTQDIL